MSKLRTVEQMLERQNRFWELRQAAARESATASRLVAQPAEGPWMTVSRQLGSGGRELARRLAHDLGWQCFDREILSQIAEHTHTREAVISRFDEQALGPINEYVSRVLVDPRLPGRAPFLQEMVKVILGLAKRGHAILIGRGANWCLEPRHGLRLRVVAPVETRVERVARDEAIERDEAARRVREHDAGQRAFIRQVYDRDIDDPFGYDIVLNTGSMTLAEAEQTVAAALRARLAASPPGK